MSDLLILMSTYNGEKYLPELLDSVYKQTYGNVDLLVRDDGSTDNTLHILNEYAANHRIQILYGKNIGAAESFFKLVEQASDSYDYYAFCDQDDVWLPKKLARAVDRLSELDSNTPNLYYSGQILVDENLKTISRHRLTLNRSYRANFIFNQMAGCTAVLNRKLFSLLKLYKPVDVFMHDAWCYKMCVTCGGNVVVDDKEYILYRQHGGNTVGLNNSLSGKFKQVQSHMVESPSSYARELKKGYSSFIDPEWRTFLDALLDKKLSNRLRLLFDPDIRFESLPLKAIFILKIIVGKY